ncbi:MAG: GIY-YIG nuclease family protein [Chloroflexi bacterium]|nr:GIY-YIG nuclease family protein [Chloroflexota bacterium]
MNSVVSGAVIQLLLVDGTPSGLTLVERLGWTGIGIACSKDRFLDSGDRKEFDESGVYVLIGQDPNTGVDSIYIGEGDIVRDRLRSHVRTKDFWERLIAFTARDARLNKAHIRYLESRLIAIASEAKRSSLQNGNAPDLPPLSEADRAYAESFLQEMLTILPILQVTAFEAPRPIHRQEAPADQGSTLKFSSGNATAYGSASGGGFTVSKGSTARVEEQKSTDPWITNLRQRLVDAGVMHESGDAVFEFAQDYEFASPTAAAVTIAGRNISGRDAWKNESGMSLKQIQEQAVGDAEHGALRA